MSNEKLMQRQRFYKIIRVFKQYHVLSNLSHQVNADEVCRAFEILGPTFVKIGQILATRTDMIKPTFAAGLSNLQDNAQVDDFATVKQIIETETGQKIEAMYQEFDAKPFASASMGQAHHAILKTGQKVVVKVQHPGIYREIMNDLALFAKVLPWLDYVPDASVFNLKDMLNELRRSLLSELDTNLELSNSEKFYQLNNHWDIIEVPKFYPQESAQKVLVSQYIDGISMRQFLQQIDNEKLDQDPALAQKCKYIAHILVENFLKQVFEDGFFHADPHPGNFLLVNDEVTTQVIPKYQYNYRVGPLDSTINIDKQQQLPPYRLAYLDFGMMGHLSPSLIKNIAHVLLAINQQDIYQIGTTVLALCEPLGEVDEVTFCGELGQFLRPYFYMGLGEIDFGKMIYQMIDICHRNNLQVNPDVTLLLKAFSTLEAIVGALDPKMSMMDVAKPFAKRYLLKKAKDGEWLTSSMMQSIDAVNAGIKLPTKILSVLDELERGQGQVTLDLKHRSNVMSKLETLVNRVVIAIVLAALIIGSSLMAEVNPGHLISEVGVIGYLIAIFSIVWLVVSDYRRRRRLKKKNK